MEELQNIEGNDALFGERVRLFQEFLDSTSADESNVSDTNYKDAIKLMLQTNSRRLIVSIDDVRNWNKDFWSGLLNNPADFLPACERALKDTVNAVFDPTAMKYADFDERTQFFIGFKGAFGANQLSPKSIKSSFLSKLISIEGIVTRTSLVRPKIVRSVHYCDYNGKFFFREYNDQTTSFNPVSTAAIYPTEDPDGHKLITEYGYSTYRDHQTISIQEMPEKADPGQLPRSIEVVLDDDLVDAVKPGDRVQIVGVYRTLGGGMNTINSFRTVLLANAVYPLRTLSTSTAAVEDLTELDIRNINQVAKRSGLFEKMSQSLAPSIYGHDHIKKAVLLMLLGGVEKNLENGTHLRGDINILMVGDPSTAKSQILRFVLNTASLAIATTGRGSSGVGLTAAVSTDRETGERKLEAGAMVLADRGVVCIDEFDKMSDVDRVAIHEVMEQQTVTIAKAGIHTSLNARCSVIAAANPVYGQYDVHKDPHQNIALPDSLLSRFDLLFVVTDETNDVRDRQLSEHVLRIHRYLPKGYIEGEPIRQFQNLSLNTGDDPDNHEDKENATAEIYEKFDDLLHGGAADYMSQKKGRKVRSVKIFSLAFIRKYVQYAKTKQPKLSAKAASYIVSVYGSLRNDAMQQNEKNTAPITARTLETLIRLATAHAKLRLSNSIDIKDAKVAEEVLKFALFKEVVKTKRTKKRKVAPTNDEEESDEEDEEDEEEEDEEEDEDMNDEDQFEDAAEPVQSRQRTSATSAATVTTASEPLQNVEDHATEQANRSIDAISADVSASRLSKFSKIIAQLIQSGTVFENESCAIDDLYGKVNETLPNEEKFNQDEFESALGKMAEKNQIMVAEEKVWIV